MTEKPSTISTGNYSISLPEHIFFYFSKMEKLIDEKLNLTQVMRFEVKRIEKD